MKNWNSDPFEDAVEDVSGGNSKIKQSNYLTAGQYPIIDQGKDLIGGYTDDEDLLYKGELPVVIFGDHTQCFKYVDFPFCIGADGVKVLRPKEGINVKFLYYFLKSQPLPEAGYDRHYKYLKRTTVKYPIEIKAQESIVQVLDLINSLVTLKRNSIEKMSQLTHSIFLDMFGDPATNPKKWNKVKIKDMGNVVTGNTPSRLISDYYGGDLEWIKSDNINTPFHILTKAKETLSKKGKNVARTVPPGSVLVTCIAGSKSCIGNIAMADREVSFNQQINALVPNNQVVTQYFIYAQLLFGKIILQNASTTGMKGMLNKSTFEELSLPCPPVEIQQKFDLIFHKNMQVESLLRCNQVKLDRLLNSISAKYFVNT